MGQRLNIEIHDNEDCLANAYYHWSAYTMSSASLTSGIIDAYYKASAIGGLPLAVELLQSTGAGLWPDERGRVRSDTTGRFSNIEFHDFVDRNEGLLSVTKPGMDANRLWEEGRVVIDIGKETVLFDVFFEYSEEDAEEFLKDYPFEYHFKELDDFDNEIRFPDFDRFYDMLNSSDGFHLKNGNYIMKIQ